MILNNIDNAMLGTDQVEAIYLGQNLVWESVDLDYATIPLTFKIISGGTINWLDIGGSLPKTIKYRVNGGEWTTIVSSDPGSTINVSPGDVVKFVGDNTAYGTGSNSNLSTFSGSTAVFDVYGNIMSLVDSTDFQEETAFTETRVFQKFFAGTGARNASKLVLPVTTLTDYCYFNMFNGCTNLTKAPSLPATTMAFGSYNSMFFGCVSLVSAPELPATTLAEYCYQSMFAACTSLTTAPELPATTLTTNCYISMFAGCTSLTTAPELPATTLAEGCYKSMFFNCRSLATAPELPATTLASDCYIGMFENCTSLATAPSVLPATTLAEYCYQQMFAGCTSLTTAPALPATTLTKSCYYRMFRNCTSLNYIKCLATDISASNCTFNWLNGVASAGTFVKNPAMSSWTTGNNGIPSGWTVVEATT